MLKRNDLVKQFELVVQQEIKNHKDSLLSTNLSINSLVQATSALDNKFEKRCSKIEKALTLHDFSHSDTKTSFEKFKGKIESSTRDLQDSNADMLRQLKDSLSCVKKCEQIQDEFKGMLSSLYVLDAEQNKTISFLERLIYSELERQRLESSKEIKKMKKEILDMPSEAKAVKEELEHTLKVQDIDFKGVFKALGAYKKTVFVIEKNIENLYTLIDRLTKKGAS